jgi:UDP-N-acetylmuramyl pentapeptide phosphotransferase/UDP-N-acetylglucosamine-1-phosphate transferase
VLVGLLVSGDSISDEARVFLGLTAVGFAVLGLMDDVRGVSPFVRLGAQFAVALGSLFLIPRAAHGLASPYLSAVGVVWLVAFVNGFNFMDGINGISTAQATIAGIAWWIAGRGQAVPSLEIGAGLAVAGAIGFAPFGFPRPLVFLGDVGSYFFGGWLALLALLGVRARIPVEAMLFPLALYLADTGTTIIRRICRGERWFHPHRDHAYQRLVRSGWSHTRTTGVVAMFITALSALGLVSLAHSMTWRVTCDVLAVTLLVGYLRLPALVAKRHALAKPTL